MDNTTKSIIELINQNGWVEIENLVLYGSRTNLSTVDCWSDIDLKVILKEKQKVTQEFISKLLKGLGKLIGKQTLINNYQVICRVVVEIDAASGVQMIDLQFTGPRGQMIIEQKSDIRDEDDLIFWFKIFLSASKFMRQDNLIGTHLLMDNLKTLLEMEMMKRDETSKTNIHRFGCAEDIEQLLELNQLRLGNRDDIVNYLSKIGEKYDQMMMERVDNYEAKNEYLLAYLNMYNKENICS